MVAVNLRVAEGCQSLPIPFWDTVWNEALGSGDWALAGSIETANKGGLQAQAALATAIILCLMTDMFCPPTHPLAQFVDPQDPRGWWGDGVDVRTDLGETALGSLLWTLERAVVTDQVVQLAQAEAIRALSPLIGQNSVVRVDAQANGVPPRNQLSLAVQLYGRDGATVYDRRWDDFWTELNVNGTAPVMAAWADPNAPMGSKPYSIGQFS